MAVIEPAENTTGVAPPASVVEGAEVARLARTMGWFDVVALGLNAPATVIATVGFSVAALGGLWAMGLWLAATIVAVLATQLYSEMAAMFPDKSGGIAMYAEEGWRRHSTLVGPLATWGYWMGWSSGVAVFAVLIATTVQAQFFASTHWAIGIGVTTLTFPKLVGAAIIIACFIINIRGVRLTVRWGYFTGVLAMVILLMLSVVPLIGGQVHFGRLSAHLGGTGFSGLRIALIWMYVMMWNVGGIEMSASFTPELRRGWRDTRKALLILGILSIITLSLIPVTSAGVLGEKAIAANPSGFTVPLFHSVLSTASWIPVILICADLFLGILAGDADGSRTLFGMANDRMTLRTFKHLNKNGVPSRALAASLIYNLFLVIFVSNTLSIIAAANLGYVIAHFFAVTGYIHLRRDRPDWPRPIRLSPIFVPVAGALTVVLAGMVVLGATGFSVTGYGGTSELIIGLAILALGWVFFLARRLLQDRSGFQWREESPRVPGDGALPASEPA